MNIELALKSKKIAELTFEEVRERVRNILAATFFIAGYKPPEERDGKALTEKLTSDLISDFGGLTMDEVAICFEMGAKESFGEFMGLNMRTFTKWLKSYKTSDVRYNAVKNSNQPSLSQSTESGSRESMLAIARRYFESYKETKEFGDLGVTVYQFLQKEKIINQSPEFKIKVVADVDKVTDKRLPKDLRHSKIINHAQIVCLKKFFDSLIEMEMDLDEFIRNETT